MEHLTTENTKIERSHATHIDIEYDGKDYMLFSSREAAEDYVEEYWRNMIEMDTKEFIYMVGADTLVQWCLGREAGPGSVKTNSLEGWIKLTRDYCVEDLATYDGQEVVVTISPDLVETLEFPTESHYYMYRTN